MFTSKDSVSIARPIDEVFDFIASLAGGEQRQDAAQSQKPVSRSARVGLRKQSPRESRRHQCNRAEIDRFGARALQGERHRDPHARCRFQLRQAPADEVETDVRDAIVGIGSRRSVARQRQQSGDLLGLAPQRQVRIDGYLRALTAARQLRREE